MSQNPALSGVQHAIDELGQNLAGRPDGTAFHDGDAMRDLFRRHRLFQVAFGSSCNGADDDLFIRLRAHDDQLQLRPVRLELGERLKRVEWILQSEEDHVEGGIHQRLGETRRHGLNIRNFAKDGLESGHANRLEVEQTDTERALTLNNWLHLGTLSLSLQLRQDNSLLLLIFAPAVRIADLAGLIRLEEENLAQAFVGVDASWQ